MGPLPVVPDVSPPDPVLPDLPPVPDLPDVPTPLDRVLELVGVVPAADAPAPVNAADRAPATLGAESAPSRFDPTDAGGILVALDLSFAPTRGPPANAPGAPHPCPAGGSPHPTRSDPAAFVDPGTGDASCCAGSLDEACVYASTSPRDPLLRPD